MVDGRDGYLEADPKTKLRPHTTLVVYRLMLRQVCRDYNVLPPVETITLGQIEFFYDGLRHELRQRTKPRKRKK